MLSLCPDIPGLKSQVGQTHVCDLGQVADFLSLSSSSHSPPYRKGKYEDSKIPCVITSQCLLPSVLMKLCTTSHWYMEIHTVVFGVICCSFPYSLNEIPPRFTCWKHGLQSSHGERRWSLVLQHWRWLSQRPQLTCTLPWTTFLTTCIYFCQDAFHHAKTQPNTQRAEKTTLLGILSVPNWPKWIYLLYKISSLRYCAVAMENTKTEEQLLSPFLDFFLLASVPSATARFSSFRQECSISILIDINILIPFSAFVALFMQTVKSSLTKVFTESRQKFLNQPTKFL